LGGGAPGGGVTNLPPPLYKERRPLPHSTPLAFASVPHSSSPMVPKYWNVHTGFEISIRTLSYRWIFGTYLFSSATLLDRSPWDATPYACTTTEVLPDVATHRLYVRMTLRPASPYNYINNVRWNVTLSVLKGMNSKTHSLPYICIV
jgi:hypothetical protein